MDVENVVEALDVLENLQQKNEDVIFLEHHVYIF